MSICAGLHLFLSQQGQAPGQLIAQRQSHNAIIAVDPFHVVKHLIQGFERLRIDLMKQCPYGSNAYYLLKKWHWLLTKDDVCLDNERVYNRRFDAIAARFKNSGIRQYDEFTAILTNWKEEILNSFSGPYNKTRD